MYLSISSSYVLNCQEEEKIKLDILKVIKGKKLPKGLEVSIVKELLEDLEKMPEHDYNKKYDTFYGKHKFFY